jgi:hypothetical protein
MWKLRRQLSYASSTPKATAGGSGVRETHQIPSANWSRCVEARSDNNLFTRFPRSARTIVAAGHSRTAACAAPPLTAQAAVALSSPSTQDRIPGSASGWPAPVNRAAESGPAKQVVLHRSFAFTGHAETALRNVRKRILGKCDGDLRSARSLGRRRRQRDARAGNRAGAAHGQSAPPPREGRVVGVGGASHVRARRARRARRAARGAAL